jgi:hypothetical protein
MPVTQTCFGFKEALMLLKKRHVFPFQFSEFLLCCTLIKFRKSFWSVVEQDLVVEGSAPLKFAGIGGVSEFLG